MAVDAQRSKELYYPGTAIFRITSVYLLFATSTTELEAVIVAVGLAP